MDKSLRDEMEFIPAKTILSRYTETNNWFGYHYNMNLYKGCCHGCIYCDSRSECYGVEDFDRVRAKTDALEILARELKSKRKKGVIGNGAMSDPYNPFERQQKLTRGALELINRHGFGAAITTKSALVTRDIDVFDAIRQHSPVQIAVTITTCDDALCRKIEPHVSVTSERFAAIKALSSRRIFSGVLMTPVLPFLEDSEENLIGIIQRARESGARYIYADFGVTLRQNQRDWYFQQLDRYFPGLKERYIQQYGTAYICRSQNGARLRRLLEETCKSAGILYRMDDIIRAYQQPYWCTQPALF